MSQKRVGVAVGGDNVHEVLAAIERAEQLGIQAAWMTTGGARLDSLTTFAAAALRTQHIFLGTSIVPTFPRHPLVVAQQTQVVAQLAPGRFRLGLGPSHRPTMQAMGIPLTAPLGHLREYLRICKALLQQAHVDFDGTYYTVHSDLNATSDLPLYISALRRNAFRLAGELADGAISWVCPLDYLRQTAGPAMRDAAKQAGRPAPRLIAHIPVAMVADRDVMLKVSRPRLENYGRLTFYARMFADAGYPVGENGAVSDELLDHLVVWGDDAEVRSRLNAAFAGGIDELLITLYSADDPANEEARLCRILAGLG